jgi:hypothetical protein
LKRNTGYGIYLLETTFPAVSEVNEVSPEEKAANLGLMKARAIRNYRLAAAPKPPKLRKRKRPHQSRTKVARAIEHSHGNWTVLAEKLDCSVSTIRKFLERSENELLLQAFQDQRVASLERCVQNLFDIANYAPVTADRLRANAFLLQKLHDDFQRVNRVAIEGGNKPVQIQSAVLQVPAEVLQLPIEAQLKVLEMADDQEKALVEDVDDDE